MSKFAVGVSVRSKDDPGRRGTITAGPRSRSDGRVYRIQWNDASYGWTPEYAFECVDESSDDAFELLQRGRFGRISDLRRNLTFIQLSGRLANVVYSMDATNTDFLAYQYKPVLNFLDSPSNGILIADEVGLGKTIEAGLIWTELRARDDACRRLVVVCPAMLRDKWSLELEGKFGIDPRQVDAAQLTNELKRDRSEIRDGQGFICSLQGLRPPSGWRTRERSDSRTRLARLLEELAVNEPVIDLLIIDEAHYLRNPETQTAALGTLLREVSSNIVLLSATPINNRQEDLFQLLRLVDPDSFESPDQFPQVISANEPLIAARDLALDPDSEGSQILTQLQKAKNHPLLANSQQLRDILSQDLSFRYLEETSNRIKLADRIERVNLLRHSVSRTRKVEVNEWKVERDAKSHFVELDPDGIERQFYDKVTRAVRSYALLKDVGDGFLLSPPQRQMSSCMYAAARSWSDRTRTLDDASKLLYEDLGADDYLDQSKAGPLIEFIAESALPGLDIEALREHDTKFDRFRQIVESYLDSYPDEKIIVFSYFKATLGYLEERLSTQGISTRILHGDVAENKQTVIEDFQNSHDARILLTSEIASEGVDLQFCSLIVNYDLPWNPMKIEQRIGRIDRIGQKSDKVLIHNLGYADSIDERIYELLLEKLNIFNRAIGGMEVVLGELINKLTSDLMRLDLSREEEESRIDRARVGIENIQRQETELEEKASHLVAHGGQILERVRAAHEFRRWISGEDLKAYVKDYLDRHLTGFTFLEDDRDPSIVSIEFPAEFASQLEDFMRRKNLHGKSRLSSGETTRCKFNNRVERLSSKVETISQFHPLVRFISESLRNRPEDICPLVAVSVSVSTLPDVSEGVYAFACKKWSFAGLRTEEELCARAISLESHAFALDTDESWDLVNAARLNGVDWFSVSNDVPIDLLEDAIDRCDILLDQDYETAKKERTNENADRVNFQKISATRHRDRLLGSLNEVLERYRLENEHHRMIPATEGRISSIERKFDRRLVELQNKGRMTPASSEVCYGVIKATTA
ncbi:MAG: SNF2-related protein [Gammaproteobacteria bacterium]|nr:SNF2-related protein [Gammaproteobacteria bacterium]